MIKRCGDGLAGMVVFGRAHGVFDSLVVKP